MKKVLLLLLVLIAVTASAQNKKQKSYMPSEGFWVVESNVKTPKQSTIYFYNNAKVLIYKESLTGRRINIGHKRTVQKLNDVLIQSMAPGRKSKWLRVILSW